MRSSRLGWSRRATAPEVTGHAGFRLNALVSLLANASWAKLAAEFIAAKDDPAELQTFVNTILAQGWREAGEEVDDATLMMRAEPFGLNHIPSEVLLITVKRRPAQSMRFAFPITSRPTGPRSPRIRGTRVAGSSKNSA
jgi:hypothetical protein